MFLWTNGRGILASTVTLQFSAGKKQFRGALLCRSRKHLTYDLKISVRKCTNAFTYVKLIKNKAFTALCCSVTLSQSRQLPKEGHKKLLVKRGRKVFISNFFQSNKRHLS